MTYGNTFIALADPTRRAVFEILARGPSPVGKLASQLPVSRPAVSQHLKVLSDAGLVTVTVDGTRRIYRIETRQLADLRAWIDRMWDDALNAFAAAAEEEHKS